MSLIPFGRDGELGFFAVGSVEDPELVCQYGPEVPRSFVCRYPNTGLAHGVIFCQLVADARGGRGGARREYRSAMWKEKRSWLKVATFVVWTR